VKILFSMRHVGSYRLYDSVLRRLAARGHEVDVLVSKRDNIEWGDVAAARMHDAVAIRWHWADDLPPNLWLEYATVVRLWLDYLRYFDDRYVDAPKLRVRAEERVPGWIVRTTARWPFRTPAGRTALARVLRAMERVMPRQAAADALIRQHAPDVVVLTPLLHLGSPQVEILRSARASRVPTALAVGSWDHLSSKSVIRDAPDRVFVWNETQRREAMELHRLEASRIDVTGAQCFDQWFDRQPRRTRAEFAQHVGLPADAPMLLWVCSALFVGSPVEAEFVQAWIDRVRRSADPLLASAAILVRPHPARLDEWKAVDLTRWPGVALHGSLPIDDASRDDYFDSLYYAAAVAGLNTSAFIEAAIVGRPVHALLLPEFQENQEGTLHFRYLLPESGGPLETARTFEEHERQLAAALRGASSGRARAFVERFVRPMGIRRPAGEVFVEAVEALRTVTPDAHVGPAWAPVARVALWPAAFLISMLLRTDTTDRTAHELRRLREKAEHRQQKEAAERRHIEVRDRERREKTERAQQAREALQRDRERERLASEREKAALKREKERRKLQHGRAKRRALLKQRIKQKLGLA
jgi:hypothetical protein